MKMTRLMSGLMAGLSTFLLSAQPEMPAGVSLGVTVNPPPAAGVSQPAPTSPPTEEAAPDVNELIKTGTVFTNSVGMVMKKVGGLWISVFETTQEAYHEVTGANPSAFAGEKRPVDSVSWQGATAFCGKLTEHEKGKDMLPDGYVYALPTQAQWESLADGVPLANAVTSSSVKRSGTSEVGSLPPSRAGLYDLRGNVAEWCADPSEGAFRILRGGSWADWIEINLRPAFRVYAAPGESLNTHGFRCVLIKGS